MAALARPCRRGCNVLHASPERESEVLTWVACGKTDAEIAMILGTRRRTIEKHVERILRKLGVNNRTRAALLRTPSGRPFKA